MNSASEIHRWNMELSMGHRICRRDEIIIKVSPGKVGERGEGGRGERGRERKRKKREFLPLQRDCR